MALDSLQIADFTDKIIIPYFKEEKNVKGVQDKIETLKKSLTSKEGFSTSLNTPYIPYFDKLSIELKIENDIILPVNYDYQVVALILDIKVGIISPIDLSQLSKFLSACNDWVRAELTDKAKESINYIYPALILSSTTPDLVKCRDNYQYLSKLILSTGIVPSHLHFSDEGIKRVISKDFGYLETDLYKFSPYGCLIYDKNYVNSEAYIGSYVIPSIAKIRCIQASFERLNNILNDEIEKTEKSTKENLHTSYEVLSRLRVSTLKSLAKAELSETLPQLTEVSNMLRKTFGIHMLQASIEKKIEILNSFFERIMEDRASRFEQKLSKVNALLAIIGVLLAVLALPPILKMITGIRL